MISVPKGLLRLAALRLFSESSLSGADLRQQIRRMSSGIWNPGPGSIYFILAELRRKELIVELPQREGTTRRYVISKKGRDELGRLAKEVDREVKKQLNLLSFYALLAGRQELDQNLKSLSEKLSS